MGYKQPPHHIYLAYQTLTNELGVTHDEALNRLALTFAGYPVDLIVQAQGDLTMTLQQLTGTPPPIRADSGKVDKRQGERLLREVVQSSSTQGQQQEGQHGSDDESQGDGVTFNDFIRARAGRGQKTTELSHAQIMVAGTGKQPDEDVSAGVTPEPEFIRAAFDRRYGRG